MPEWKGETVSGGDMELAARCQQLETQGYEVKFIVPYRLPKGGITPGTEPEPGFGVYYIVSRKA